MVGKKYGRLTVLGELSKRWSDGSIMLRCRCDCGNITTRKATRLRTGRNKSCGCLQKKVGEVERHGKCTTPEYESWKSMLARCHNPNAHAYQHYGGRGITVCRRWRASFLSFYEDMGPRPHGHSIDRIDNNKGYSKKNCKWSTQKQQTRNMRRNRVIAYKGKSQPLLAWAEETGISYQVLQNRLKKTQSLDEVFLPTGSWYKFRTNPHSSD